MNNQNYVVETTVEYKTKRNRFVLTTNIFVNYTESEDDAKEICRVDTLAAVNKLTNFYDFEEIDDCEAEVTINQKVIKL